MRFRINAVVFFDRHERQVVEEALRPYNLWVERYKTWEHVDATEARFVKALNRCGGELRMDWLLDMHELLIDLLQALIEDGERWRREAKDAPEKANDIVMRPKMVLTMLADTRDRQAIMCSEALDIVRVTMEALKPIEAKCRKLEGGDV